jgi:hypothetical protein
MNVCGQKSILLYCQPYNVKSTKNGASINLVFLSTGRILNGIVTNSSLLRIILGLLKFPVIMLVVSYKGKVTSHFFVSKIYDRHVYGVGHFSGRSCTLRQLQSRKFSEERSFF